MPSVSMTSRPPLAILAFPLVLLAVAPRDASAQLTVARPPAGGRAAPAAEASGSSTRLTLRVGEREYSYGGVGQCVHAPRASLFGRTGRSWTVQVKPPAREGLRSFTVTVWRFDADGRQTFTMYTAVGAANYRVSTTDGDPGHGSGTATVTPRGSGGTIELVGRTEDGTPIRASIECTRFAAPYAVGG